MTIQTRHGYLEVNIQRNRPRTPTGTRTNLMMELNGRTGGSETGNKRHVEMRLG